MSTTSDPTPQASRERSWWSLEKAEWRNVLKATLKEFSADEVSNLSAVVTLRIVLALVPGLIAAVAIAAQVISTDDIESLVASAGSIIPGSARDFVAESLDTAIQGLQEKGTVALVISIGAGLFAASGAAAALVNALNKAFDVQEGRGFVGQRLISLGVIGAMAVALSGMFVAIVLGPTLLDLLLPTEILDSPLRFLITIGRYVAGILILILFFGFAFWFGPNRDRPPLRFLTPGAVLGVVGWLLLSWLFGIYVSVAGSYSATYGAFAGVIVLLVWMNYSFSVLLMGAELDHEIELLVTAADAAATPPAAAVGQDVTTAVDLDDVVEGMPRHPGLVTAAVDAQVTGADDAHHPARRQGPVPSRMLGAAASTSGASLARTLWGRLASRR